MDYDPYYTHNGMLFASWIGIVLVFTAIWLIVVAGFYVLDGFAFMLFIRKVGVKPWIAWVPFYNRWVWLEVGGQPGWIALLRLISPGALVTLVFLCISMYRTGLAMTRSAGYVVLGAFFPWAWAFVMGGSDTVYRPELITAAGYSAPLAGYGSVRPNFANVGYVRPQP